MEVALYCPIFGYYERLGGAVRVGRQGDFITSVSVGKLFGGLLAFQFSAWLEELPGPQLDLVEAGAHDGALAADILAWFRLRRPDLVPRLRYWVVEPSPRRQGWQRARLDKFAGQVRWIPALSDLPSHSVQGVVFSNELLDAFPVNRLGWDAARSNWFEWGVAQEAGRFAWRRLPVTPHAPWPARLRSLGLEIPPELAAVLPDGFTLDVCPAAGDWWRQAASVLAQGRLLTFDYGLMAQEFLLPRRASGTLRAYSRQHAVEDPLADPGGQDLTAHVNFTDLEQSGEALGLVTERFESQEAFLSRVAAEYWRGAAPSREEVRQFQTLVHPEHFGRSFRVLLQRRGE